MQTIGLQKLTVKTSLCKKQNVQAMMLIIVLCTTN